MAGVTETIERIHDAWRAGRADDLHLFFDLGMVIVGPGDEVLVRGVDACVANCRRFLRTSVVHKYRQSALSIHEAAPVAVATFVWEMNYENIGRRSHEKRTDLFVLRPTGETRLAVCRANAFNPPRPSAPAVPRLHLTTAAGERFP